MKQFVMVPLTLLVILSGCSWVKLTPEGREARVASEAEVANCNHVGTSTVSLLDKVAGIKRDPKKVQEELNTLARNAAGRMAGDTVVPLAPPDNGEQQFRVYRCD